MGATQECIYCFELILKVADYKTAALWPLASHLTNYLNKTNKVYWTLLKNERPSLGTPTHGHTSAKEAAKTCEDTRFLLVDLLTQRERERERERFKGLRPTW